MNSARSNTIQPTILSACLQPTEPLTRKCISQVRGMPRNRGGIPRVLTITDFRPEVQKKLDGVASLIEDSLGSNSTNRKIHTTGKIALTFEPMMQFGYNLTFRMF